MELIEKEILERFEPISLEEMEKVKLMNRIDTKYVTNVEGIRRLLQEASNDYFLQTIEGESLMPYYTLYYDTPDCDMYYQHQRGKKTRQKVRTRLYEGTMETPFLEIKKKNNKGRTRKKRVLMEEGEQLPVYEEFLSEHCVYPGDILLPRISNHFYRITLVSKSMTERITIDLGLEFRNLSTGNETALPNIGIIELKRDGNAVESRMQRILRSLHIHESGFSKYCIGMAITNPALKQNRIKNRLRMIGKISKTL